MNYAEHQTTCRKNLDSETFVDLVIDVKGEALPSDHGYALMSAISNIIPSIHSNETILMSSINGIPQQNGMITLANSVFRIRSSIKNASLLIHKLAGKELRINGNKIKLGVPRIEELEPADTLKAWMVTIKFSIEPENFIKAAKMQLDKMGITADFDILRINGVEARRIIRIKGTTFVGYTSIVSNLSKEDSIRLQKLGIGGKKRMGAGFFLPHKTLNGGNTCGNSKQESISLTQ